MMKKSFFHALMAMMCLTLGVCGCENNPLTPNQGSAPTSQASPPVQPDTTPTTNTDNPSVLPENADPLVQAPDSAANFAPTTTEKIQETAPEASESAVDYATAFMKFAKVQGRYKFNLGEPQHFFDENATGPTASKWMFKGDLTVTKRGTGTTQHGIDVEVYLDPKDNMWKVLSIVVDDGQLYYDGLADDAQPLVRDSSSRKVKDDGDNSSKKTVKKDTEPLTAEEQAAKNEKDAAVKLALAKQFLKGGKSSKDKAKKRLKDIVEKFPGTKAAETAATLLGNL